MKNLSATLLCLLSIGCASSVHAQVQEFGPDTARFTIDVPSNWEVKATQTGVELADGEKATFLSIAIGNTRGRTPEQIANTLTMASTFAKKRGFSNMVKKGPGLFVLHGETDTGLRKTLVLFVENERYATCTMSGKNMEAVAKITDSLKAKRNDEPSPAAAEEAAMPAGSMNDPANADSPKASDDADSPLAP